MKKKIDTERLHLLYHEIWEERKINGKNYSEISGEYLGKEPLTIYFDHLLDKHLYENLIYDKRNIILVTFAEHQKKNNGFPLGKHSDLIEKAKKELL